VGHIYDTNISTKKEWIDIAKKWHLESKIDLLKPGKGEWKGENGGTAFAEVALYIIHKRNSISLGGILNYFNKNIK